MAFFRCAEIIFWAIVALSIGVMVFADDEKHPFQGVLMALLSAILSNILTVAAPQFEGSFINTIMSFAFLLLDAACIVSILFDFGWYSTWKKVVASAVCIVAAFLAFIMQ